jgi:hypothetical protein
VVKSVPDMLKDLSKIHAERSSIYGDDFMHIGEVLLGMFPNGLHLQTSEDFNRFALFLYQVTKLARYAQNMAKFSTGHPDSLDDIAVYSQLLQYFDTSTAEADQANAP